MLNIVKELIFKRNCCPEFDSLIFKPECFYLGYSIVCAIFEKWLKSYVPL